jgi:hypothetical protein
MKNCSAPILSILLGLAGATEVNAAGNVTATISGEYLYIVGDAADNKIKVSDKDNDGMWTVSGSGGTLINGIPSVTIAVQNHVRIYLQDGDDQLKLSDTNVLGYFDVELGSGEDKATISNTTIGQTFRVKGEEQGDKVSIKNVVVTARCEFDMDDLPGGEDSLKIKGLSSTGIDIFLEDFDDKATIADITFPTEEFSFFTLSAGGGKDSVKVSALESVYFTVEMSDGDYDSVKVSKCTAQSTTLDGGAGVGDKLVVDEESSLGSGTPVNFEQ